MHTLQHPWSLICNRRLLHLNVFDVAWLCSNEVSDPNPLDRSTWAYRCIQPPLASPCCCQLLSVLFLIYKTPSIIVLIYRLSPPRFNSFTVLTTMLTSAFIREIYGDGVVRWVPWWPHGLDMLVNLFFFLALKGLKKGKTHRHLHLRV